MSDSPSRAALPDGGDNPRQATESRGRRVLLWSGGVVVLVIVAIVAAALTPGSHSGEDRTPPTATQATVSAHLTANPLHRQHKVFDSRIAASKYGGQVAVRENGYDANGPISDLTPLRPSQFVRPENEYRRYAERWAAILGRDVAPLTAALKAGDRGRAKRNWLTAFSDYQHLGAVYGLLPGYLNDELARVPASTSDNHFPGLHRIEKGLWTDESLSTLVPVATKLGATVVRLRHRLPTVTFDPLAYVARGHEILEDAQRDLMSGAQVPWSGAGVLGTAAGLVATERVVRTLVPLLNGRGNTLPQVQVWLIRVRRVLGGVRRQDGSYPSLGQLTTAQRETINGVLAGAMTALEELPPTLEAAETPVIPSIPVHTETR